MPSNVGSKSGRIEIDLSSTTSHKIAFVFVSSLIRTRIQICYNSRVPSIFYASTQFQTFDRRACFSHRQSTTVLFAIVCAFQKFLNYPGSTLVIFVNVFRPFSFHSVSFTKTNFRLAGCHGKSWEVARIKPRTTQS